MELKIRPAVNDDVQDIQDLSCRSGLSPWSLHSLKRSVADPLCELNLAEPARSPAKKVIGFYLARIILNEMELLQIAVDPKLARKEIGRKLLAHCMKKASVWRCNVCYLEVRSSNETALCFYRKHGFQSIGRRRGYYTDPEEDALILSKQI
jgi:ribosomal-protein-alanine N-acetyltransferase